MILVDRRTGSVDLAGYLSSLRIETKVVTLDYGDVAFCGSGPEGQILVGIEVKKVKDALACMVDGRFAGHQLPGLREQYGRFAWLLVEGVYNADYKTGILMVPKGKKRQEAHIGARRFMYRDFDSWLTTMELRGGVHVKRSGSRAETARIIANLYGWFNHKDWEEHHSHLTLSTVSADAAALVHPSIVRRVAAELPGIGWRKSQEVARKFKTIEEMVLADEREWATIEGIGGVMAERIYKAIHGG